MYTAIRVMPEPELCTKFSTKFSMYTHSGVNSVRFYTCSIHIKTGIVEGTHLIKVRALRPPGVENRIFVWKYCRGLDRLEALLGRARGAAPLRGSLARNVD